MESRVALEVCVASVEDAVAACANGADRIELNVALELGGLTPSLGLVREVKQAVAVPVIAMVRTRAAGFCYSASERQVMLRDVDSLIESGADGVAVGALVCDGSVDFEYLKQIRDRAHGRDVVFHRAFDLIRQPELALNQLVDCGVTRVLTSGGGRTAREGSLQLGRLNHLAGDQIQILPGGGVTAENVLELLAMTGCEQVHGSFSLQKQDPAGFVTVESYPGTCPRHVARTRLALDQREP